MQIAGIETCSFVDWPGMMAAAVFTPGCNLDCFFCHNHRLLCGGSRVLLPTSGLLTWLESRHGLLDGVVITGGEPTLQPGLERFIEQVRERGFPVKLDTNGTRPERLAHLLETGMLDYVAMDVKAPREKYQEVCGARVNARAVDASIQCIMDKAPAYEFRTTVLPQFTEDDIESIARRIAGARQYYLQAFRPIAQRGDQPPDLRLEHPPHGAYMLAKMAQRALHHVRRCTVRGLAQETRRLANSTF